MDWIHRLLFGVLHSAFRKWWNSLTQDSSFSGRLRLYFSTGIITWLLWLSVGWASHKLNLSLDMSARWISLFIREFHIFLFCFIDHRYREYLASNSYLFISEWCIRIMDSKLWNSNSQRDFQWQSLLYNWANVVGLILNFYAIYVKGNLHV